jgi:penicillin-insensitive murein endopeptidase
MRRWFVIASLGLWASATAAQDAGTTATTSAAVPLSRATPETSTSIGGPNEGHLDGGVPLPRHAPGLLSNPRRPNHDAYFGTYELIHSLVAAAAVVHRALPGGTVTVSDIGFREGGVIPHHGSHRAGRDVDVLFYMLDMEGQPRDAMAVPIDPEGHGTDYGDLVDPTDDVPMQLDVPRTWRFVQALLADDDALVQRIFVVEHVRTLLLSEAARVHAPRAIVHRFEDVTCQPGYPHDDHLHVRYFCTTEDIAGGCEDAPPIYPWRREQLTEAGVEAAIAHPHHRTRETAPTAPPDGTPMDAAVRTFLDRRATWASQPHPGRRYCR